MHTDPKDIHYEDVSIGDVYTFKHIFSHQDLKNFSKLTGDENPLHLNQKFAVNSGFKSNVVYGMLSASLFSRLIGMHCPGKNALYISQTIDFRNPIYPNQELKISGTILNKYDKFRMIKLKTEILNRETICVSGIAKARFNL
ncbi:MaoC family dehydratase [Gammaproteobacteria bacterium]|nr:MaoC family dehydratase [Gammaproteobacteria bacterium]